MVPERMSSPLKKVAGGNVWTSWNININQETNDIMSLSQNIRHVEKLNELREACWSILRTLIGGQYLRPCCDELVHSFWSDWDTVIIQQGFNGNWGSRGSSLRAMSPTHAIYNCRVLGKLLNLSMSQFLHVVNGDTKAYLRGLMWDPNRWTRIFKKWFTSCHT